MKENTKRILMYVGLYVLGLIFVYAMCLRTEQIDTKKELSSPHIANVNR